MNDLDENGSGDAVGLHEAQEGFGGGIFGWRVGAGSEGKGGIVLPDVDVGVDEQGAGGRCCGERADGGGCDGCGDETAAVPHKALFPGGDVREVSQLVSH